MEPFSINTIDSINELYGREDIIYKATAYANRRENIAFIGSRRFGKTCLLKSLYNHFHEIEDSPVFPVYYDFKEVGGIVEGTYNAYRFILAKLIEELYERGFYTDSKDYPELKITPSSDWADNYDKLKSYSETKLYNQIGKVIKHFSYLMDRTILFMIDEYEHLFQNTFNKPSGFVVFRNLSTDRGEKSIKPFAFWVAGSVGWKELCSFIGSPELNVINATLPVLPIEKEDFMKMWQYEISLCKDKEKSELLSSKAEDAFQKTGGVPYYAKLLGTELLLNDNEPDYLILEDYFDQIYRSMNEQEQALAKMIAIHPKKYNSTSFLTTLKNKGLITCSPDGKYHISIGFFTDYLKTKINDDDNINKDSIENITKQIFDLFKIINDQRKKDKKDRIFDLTDEDVALNYRMRNLCQSNDDFTIFLTSVHLTFTEKSKAGDKKGFKLPDPIRYGDFYKAIDSLRNVYVGHLESKLNLVKGQMPKFQALFFFWGSENSPFHPYEFAKLQMAILKKYQEELEKLLDLVREEK